jgi:TolA-binding protein
VTRTNERKARTLLASFEQDEVPVQSKERAWAAFGIAAGVASASALANGAAANAAKSVAPGATFVARGALSWGTLSVVKTLIVAAAVGAGVAAVQRATVATHPSRAEDRIAVIEAAPPATAPTVAADDHRGARAETEIPEMVALPNPTPPAPVETARIRASARTRAASPVTAQSGGVSTGASKETPSMAVTAPAVSTPSSSLATLAGEVARLDRSRAALRRGSAARALRELADYDAEFPNGALRQEAMVLRIEVLVAMGEDDRARILADAFAKTHPKSGYLVKIRELLAP